MADFISAPHEAPAHAEPAAFRPLDAGSTGSAGQIYSDLSNIVKNGLQAAESKLPAGFPMFMLTDHSRDPHSKDPGNDHLPATAIGNKPGDDHTPTTLAQLIAGSKPHSDTKVPTPPNDHLPITEIGNQTSNDGHTPSLSPPVPEKGNQSDQNPQPGADPYHRHERFPTATPYPPNDYSR
jgi:hypothetical protein